MSNRKVRAESLKIYRPSRWASADPFAFTDATILARASRLAFPPTRVLTAGGGKRKKMA